MKIFAVYGRLDLTNKPEWFDAFRAKYGMLSEFHVTLKQPCLINAAQISDVREKLDDIFGDVTVPGHRIEMGFDRLQAEKDAIMIHAREGGPIMELQERIRDVLKDYGRYVRPELKAYEYDFHPHVSIVTDLTPEQYAAAIAELKPDCRCEGVIEEIVLVVVDAVQSGKSAGPASQIIYHL